MVHRMTSCQSAQFLIALLFLTEIVRYLLRNRHFACLKFQILILIGIFELLCRELSLGVYLLQWPFLLFASLPAPVGEVGVAAPGWFMRAGRGDGAERAFVVFLGLLLLLALSAVVAYGLQRPAVALVKRWTASAVK